MKKRAGSRNPAPKPAQVVGAAQAADLGLLKELVRRGGDVNASWRNYRPLHALLQEKPHGGEHAPTRERLACLDWLLAHGADPEALGAWPSMRAILVAAFTGVKEFVERLRTAGARVDLHVEAALGEEGAVGRRLARDESFADARDEGGLTPLMACAGSRLGRDDARVRERLCAIGRRLLDAGADPNARVRSWGHDVDVAYFAIGARQAELLELLLARGADVDRALVSAAWSAPELAERALAHGAMPDRAREGDRPILNELVRWGQVEPALWLLARGAGPNVSDPRGWTAMHQAASRGSETLLRALLAAGGDPRRPDAAGHTPLDFVRVKRKPKLVALLESKPAPAKPALPRVARSARRKA